MTDEEELERLKAKLAADKKEYEENRSEQFASMRERAGQLRQSTMPLADDVADILEALVFMAQRQDQEHEWALNQWREFHETFREMLG